MIRETIYAALFAALPGSPTFKTKSRRLQHWQDTPSGQQPALFISQTGEQALTVTGQPSRWLMKVDVYVYARCSKTQNPSEVLNPLIDAVCNALNTPHPVTGRTQLGLSNVEFARVEGAIETDEGTLGEQCVAIIPVVILAT